MSFNLPSDNSPRLTVMHPACKGMLPELYGLTLIRGIDPTNNPSRQLSKAEVDAHTTL